MAMTITQKDTLAGLRNLAADLGAIVSIRKNSYGEYDARIRMNGTREYVWQSFGERFSDVAQDALDTLNGIMDAQRAEGVRRQREHDDAVAKLVETFASTFSSLGLTLYMLDHVVTMYSPKTGTHSLNMRFGVRPVSDLVPHLCGFIEGQTHTRSK